jgi:micrococcal nuclease
MVMERLFSGLPVAVSGAEDGKPSAHVMRLPALIASVGLALAPLSAMAATVISVGDGDTLRVEDGGRKITIRVFCIHAPEMAQAPYGQQARQALQELLPVGSTVTLKAQTTDRYGRTIAEVFAQNDTNAGLTLVQQGHAFAYRQ